MAEQSYGDWIRSNPPSPTKEFKKQDMAQMKIFKELSKIGFKHYTENSIEELDNLPLDSEERIMEQSLVFLWFRKKYDLYVNVTRYNDEDEYKFLYHIDSGDVEEEFNTYHEAELAAIAKLIEIVRKQKLNNKHMAQLTALKWLYEIMFVKKGTITFEEYQHALEMEKHQHGQTWDSAIKAHDDRGHVHARSLVDFDEWYEEQFKK